MNHNRLRAAAVVGSAVLSLAQPALACVGLAPARLQGETEEQWVTRAHSEEQSRFRAEAEAVFLAEVSMIRRVGTSDIEISYTPVAHLAGSAMPTAALTVRQHEGNTCRRDEQVGEEVVVYSRGVSEDEAIVGLVSPNEILDRDMRRVIRAYQRGQMPSGGPTYGD